MADLTYPTERATLNIFILKFHKVLQDNGLCN